MALRKVITKEDELLRKKCKPVTAFDEKLAKLLDDMKETLYKENGYGLAAPQIAMLRRITVIDVGEGFLEVINPEILEQSGAQRGVEGCLSCPTQYGYVTRPDYVKFRAQDRNGNFYEKEARDLFARCVCHELDHLDGKLFLDIVEEMVEPEEDE
ncbi:MAG: peptide deformylase [Oscillospiraceae bacterium]